MESALFWFRRDLRAFDNAGLSAALQSARRVYCLFVFDTDILDALSARADRRVEFIRAAVEELRTRLEALGGGLIIAHGSARTEVPAWAARLNVDAVFTNRDYEPAALARDAAVADSLAAAGRELITAKDQVIFEAHEVEKKTGGGFNVFTPYRNAWLNRLTEADLAEHPVASFAYHLAPPPATPLPSLKDLGFTATNLADLRLPLGQSGGEALLDDFQLRIDRYHETRDYPAVKGVSYLSAHLRFGTVSIRRLAGMAWQRGGDGAQSWLSELIWREFYSALLTRCPEIVAQSFRPEFRDLAYPNPPGHFEAWMAGRTGYPLVDAAQRQILQTGWMHNRLRMVTASFLIKDLLVDWRLGEAWFATHLLDFDLASNNGGWQWCASTGCDGQPWFRIFNPVTQSERFDPKGAFIRRYVPELANCPERYIHAPWTMDAATQQACGIVIGRDYPAPLVHHAEARAATLALYKQSTSG